MNLPTRLRFLVTNEHSDRYNAIGYAVTTLTRSELEGREMGVEERAIEVVLDFEDGREPESFARDDVRQVRDV